MKKLVGLLVFVVLVLAGCSADNTSLTRMPEANQPAGEKQDAVNSPEVKIPETVPANESETMNQESADWQVYSNNRYSYSIKYPANWFIDTTYSEVQIMNLSAVTRASQIWILIWRA